MGLRGPFRCQLFLDRFQLGLRARKSPIVLLPIASFERGLLDALLVPLELGQRRIDQRLGRIRLEEIPCFCLEAGEHGSQVPRAQAGCKEGFADLAPVVEEALSTFDEDAVVDSEEAGEELL